ncbi:HNH endonuclease signature motif containing protein [soil metagenome]
MTSPDTLDTALAAATRALEAVRFPDLETVTDGRLLALIGQSAQHERLARAHSASLAGELLRRSDPQLGHDGLAQKLGHRTPQKLIQATTGGTSREAAQAVRVGGLSETHPWLGSLRVAIADGSVSTDAADAIRAGLGAPAEGVSAEMLAQTASRLGHESRSLDADRLFLRARELRDELDAAGIVDRERAARDAREFRLQRLRDGGVRIVWKLDALEGSVVTEVYDRATSPRRGGPRFVTDADRAQQIADDPRSTEQLASDVFYELVTAGAEVAPTRLLGRGAPAVRVTITERELRARTGHGRLQGGQLAVSIETVERLACTQGTIPIVFDEHGQPLDVGREHRLFTARQRIALTERDGGCRWTGCERQPSWCEAHHIEHWARDGGRTDVADGLLLCRHHHLLLHDQHWEIERRGPERSEYWLIPPPGHPDPVPRRLESRSLGLRGLLAG